ncbi:hypothetical protein XI25_17765 [Paenibacillus sp. DMB20]|nr:hypothetical protein XI25_17765 [Paenibacillus sp. DMB20]
MKSRATPMDTSDGGDWAVSIMAISLAAISNRKASGHEMEFRFNRTMVTLLSKLFYFHLDNFIRYRYQGNLKNMTPIQY